MHSRRRFDKAWWSLHEVYCKCALRHVLIEVPIILLCVLLIILNFSDLKCAFGSSAVISYHSHVIQSLPLTYLYFIGFMFSKEVSYFPVRLSICVSHSRLCLSSSSILDSRCRHQALNVPVYSNSDLKSILSYFRLLSPPDSPHILPTLTHFTWRHLSWMFYEVSAWGSNVFSSPSVPSSLLSIHRSVSTSRWCSFFGLRLFDLPAILILCLSLASPLCIFRFSPFSFSI